MWPNSVAKHLKSISVIAGYFYTNNVVMKSYDQSMDQHDEEVKSAICNISCRSGDKLENEN